MKNILPMLGLATFVFVGVTPLWADDYNGTSPNQSYGTDNPQHQMNGEDSYQPPKRVIKPLFLDPQHTLQNLENLEDADVPSDYNGTSLNYDSDDAPPSPHFMTPLIGSTFASQVQRYNRKETGPGQYYWHFYQKRRYSHFTDSQGNHWYGGASDEANHKWAMLLWKNGRFWWHDTNNDRWLYYYKTYWWAQDDQNPSMVDVYLNGNYYPCDRTGLIQIPQATQGRWDSDHQRRGRDKRDEDRAHTGGQGDDRGKDWKHQDGQKDRAGANDNNNAGSRDLGESKYYDPAKTRLVTVSGTNRDAFLYDVTPAHTLDHVYLISNVADVQFANDATGKAWMITFILQDGTRKGYNADGHLTMP